MNAENTDKKLFRLLFDAYVYQHPKKESIG